MANDELILGAEFPAPGKDDWMKLVDKVLAGAPFDHKLVTTTYEGLKIQPLYVDGDGPGPDAAGRPGLAPFMRGRVAESTVPSGWDVRQYHGGGDVEERNRAILTDLERGVTSIVLGPGGIGDVDQLDRCLNGVHLDLAPICLDFGPRAEAGAAMLTELWRRRGLSRSEARGELGFDPLGTLARHGRLAGSIDEELSGLGAAAQRTVADWPQVRTVRVDASIYADAGGSDALEVAAALATGVVYLRTMIDAGLGLADALDQIGFRFTADADQFATMAKLRAARRCWSRVVQACAIDRASPATAPHPDLGGMYVHAVTACAMYSRRDPWVNMLRATLGCFGAAVAGADAITVLPFGAAAGQWDELGVRLARNTQIILAEESGLHRVSDPAGGSWYIESRSDALATEAWSRFQRIEAAGGMAAALLDGSIIAEVNATWEDRRANLARRKDPLTGVSEFPNLDEQALEIVGSLDVVDTSAASLDEARRPDSGTSTRIEPLPLRRRAEPFEALRDRAEELAGSPAGAPTVFLANLGPIPTHAARAGFAKNFFEVGGIRALENTGFTDPDEAAAAFVASGSTRAVICSSDAVYADQAAATARALKASGCRTVYLAGNPGDARADLEAAGVDEFVFVGCDLLDILGRALDS